MSTSSAKPPYHHGELRRALLDAALAALAAGGSADVGLRALARSVGVSPAAPYRHFKDRQALLEALAAEGFQRFGAALQAARDGVGEADQLPAMARAYIGFAMGQPQLFRLMFSAELDKRGNRALRDAADAAYAALAVAAAREDEIAPGEVAITAWAFVHGLAMLLLDEQILGVSAANADGLVRSLTSRFVAGLRASRLG